MFSRISNFLKTNTYSVNIIDFIKNNKFTTCVSTYAFIRSIYINENILKYDLENNDYRKLLNSEKIFYTFGQTSLSLFMYPLFIYNDACIIEKKYKNMKINESELYIPYFNCIWIDQYNDKIKLLK